MKQVGKVLCFLVCLGMMVFSGTKLYGIYSGYRNSDKVYEKLEEQYVVSLKETAETYDADMAENGADQRQEAELISVDFVALKETCDDIVGWIYCPDTRINYPIVQSNDNDYYLHRLINGEYNAGGTLFMDCRNSSDFSDWNSIIYGHNMKNGSMFSVLPKYIDQEFYEEHPVWYLLTPECSYVVEFVGGYVTAADSAAYAFPKNAEGKKQLADVAARSSSFRSGVAVGEEEKLVTFSTCVYDFENARYVLIGVLRHFETIENE